MPAFRGFSHLGEPSTSEDNSWLAKENLMGIAMRLNLPLNALRKWIMSQNWIENES
jgi:hypothetical protein